MYTTAKLRQAIQSVSGIVRRVIYYISGAVARIFSPSDDQYPATGVQPFEGRKEKRIMFPSP